MKKIERKARKQYECDYCGEQIHKGEIYQLYEEKAPKYKFVEDIFEEQIGIIYVRGHLHIKCPTNLKSQEER